MMETPSQAPADPPHEGNGAIDDSAAPSQPPASAPYNEHVNYLIYLESSDSHDHNDLQQARETFADAYPLGESQWVAWIDAEISAGNTSYACDLCERAVKDYIVVSVWVRWLELASVEQIINPDGGILQLAIRCGAASHFQEGVAIWRTARKRLIKQEENEVHAPKLLIMQSHTPLKGNGEEEGENEAVGKSISDFDTDLLLRTYGWKGPRNPSDIEELVNVCESFEKKLVEARGKGVSAKEESGIRSDELTYAYGNYAHYLEESGFPNIAKSVLERNVAEAFLDVQVWKSLFFFTTRNPPMRVSAVIDRAVRNVPQSEELWVMKFRHSFCSSHDFLCAYKKCPIKTVEIVYTVLHVCKTRTMPQHTLSPPFESLSAQICRDAEFQESTQEWAEINSVRAEMVSDVSLMEDVVSKCGADMRWWVVYIDMLAKDIHAVRALYSRALDKVSNAHVQEVAWKWKRWELLHGTIQDYENAERQILVRFKGLWNQGEKRAEERGKRWREARRKRPRKEQKANGAHHPNGVVLNKVSSTAVEGGMDVDHEYKGTKEGDRRVTEEEMARDTEENRRKRGDIVKAKDNKQQDDTKQGEALDPSNEFEPGVVFVNNLAFNVSKKQLELFFSTIPGFVEARLLVRADRASKGMGYVEFEDDKGVKAALEKHEQMLGGRTIWVRRSKPPRGNKSRDGGQFRRGRGKVRKFTAQRGAHHRQRLDADIINAESSDVTMKGVEQEEEKATEEKNLSQNDFRSMLLGRR
eukprot:Plantae.Rhodophyta-Hildenbrandia_rubra.ctg12704.p1 GENE.Plantae.Rhodophyta-Hildenbrandia_rubra.ctg12704~~Plantae.Rhodophyta-Hildenbrandia_rubra.ctg12704.p1  ORF type:complete len:754 (-),score=122.55 Plantae.Rhodophyta-Hildenbrandia_rubra.ctg12704:151-2412(-)